ncbi:hypothetical protein AKJ09_09367 [Labilithrix luteola]|uniref:Uncharacterized protein n=1 Tax=Labilithrix luteola TaxID=1391654 RepID=A0A0K1QAE7_9BACT|nr:hypothetical protein AKJ09_09367 [Labilithrix luteola]
MVSLWGLAACSNSDSKSTSEGADAGPDASELCPNVDSDRVHYQDHDPNRCSDIVLDCTVDQNGFDNACGCGCIDKGDDLCPSFDDPAITWISRDPAQCPADPPQNCPKGQNPFSTSCGCGCVLPGG